MPPRHDRAPDRITRLLAAALSCAWLVSACNGGDDAPAPQPGDGGCEAITDAPLDCTPSFDPPDFAAIYHNVIEARCGSRDTGCHGNDAPSGLVMTEAGEAYSNLLGELDDSPRVAAGHPECSELVLRVESPDRRVRMPLNGAPLDDGAICAIRHWIADGAEGP